MFSVGQEPVGADVSHASSSSSCSSSLLCLESVQCMAEDASEVNVIVSTCDGDSDDSITKQRRCHSSALLKKQQKLSTASPDMFIKVCILRYIIYGIKESVTAKTTVEVTVMTV